MEALNQSIVRPAGFWRRVLAQILDTVVIFLPLSILSFLITGDWEGDLFTSIISILYVLVLPVIWYGYTVGKRMVGIRIAKVNGDKVGIGTMLMRAVVATLIYGVTLGIALIISAFMVGLRKDKRGIHDFIAGTYVTHERP